MPQVWEVLRQKEIAVERVRREVEALRLVCPLLDDGLSSTLDNLQSSIEREHDFPRFADYKKDSSEPIAPRILEAERNEIVNQLKQRNVLLEFGQVALGASRTFLKRVLDSRLLEGEPQRKGIRDFIERLGRSSAA